MGITNTNTHVDLGKNCTSMQPDKEQRIYKFLQNNDRAVELRSKEFLYNESGSPRPKRTIFYRLRNYLENYLHGRASLRSFFIHGLRGVGKTTILYQLFDEHSDKLHPDFRFGVKKLFVSVDHIVNFLGATLHEVLEVYEKYLGCRFEELKEPLLLFFDEVQNDPQWVATLKSLYDRTKNICVFAAGPTSLTLHASPDLERRVVFEKILPLSFLEYIEIQRNLKFDFTLSENIQKALLDSPSVEDLYNELLKYDTEIKSFWMQIDTLEIDRYIKYGSLPFMLSLDNEALIYGQIKRVIDRISNIDLRDQDRFRPEVASKIPMIIYSVADIENLSLRQLAQEVGISKPTLAEVFDALEKAGLIVRIYPHGPHISQVRKSSKYLFAAPVLRSMYFNYIGNIEQNNSDDKLMQDLVTMYFSRFLLSRFNSTLTFDSVATTDFIVRLNNEYLVYQAGADHKTYRQINKTIRKVKAKYGINICKGPLALSAVTHSISLPLEYLLVT